LEQPQQVKCFGKSRHVALIWHFAKIKTPNQGKISIKQVGIINRKYEYLSSHHL